MRQLHVHQLQLNINKSVLKRFENDQKRACFCSLCWPRVLRLYQAVVPKVGYRSEYAKEFANRNVKVERIRSEVSFIFSKRFHKCLLGQYTQGGQNQLHSSTREKPGT